VSPLEVESVLLSHPAVVECAVVGRADADGLVKVCAYVVLRDTTPTRELDDLAVERLARHKRPRWIVAVDELPKTATGKVQRFRLRDTVRA
jgi:acyl-coenzyme A synthetase/AMP-(fatty) acid ligase